MCHLLRLTEQTRTGEQIDKRGVRSEPESRPKRSQQRCTSFASPGSLSVLARSYIEFAESESSQLVPNKVACVTRWILRIYFLNFFSRPALTSALRTTSHTRASEAGCCRSSRSDARRHFRCPHAVFFLLRLPACEAYLFHPARSSGCDLAYF